jgi:hypothetical protein
MSFVNLLNIECHFLGCGGVYILCEPTYRRNLSLPSSGQKSLLPSAHTSSPLSDFSTLKMEAIRFSETSVHIRPTRRYIPEDGIFHSHRCENVKSYIIKYVLIYN